LKPELEKRQHNASDNDDGTDQSKVFAKNGIVQRRSWRH
jgi:hypothetical protein